MFLWRRLYALMAEAGEGGAGGVAGGSAAAASSAAAGGAGGTAAGTGGAAGGAAGAGGTGAAGAAGSGAAGGAAAGSALAGGAAGTEGTSSTAPTEWLPDKYRVAKPDGTLDVEGSARKLAEAHGTLERRMGDVGVAPKTAEEYAVAVPEALKGAFQLDSDEMFKSFRGKMHGLGLTQKQFDGVMTQYFETVPSLVAGGGQVTEEQATAELQKTWSNPTEYTDKVKLAYRAGSQIAQAAGLSFEDLETSGLANNPTFIKLMAAIGPEFAEGTSITQPGGGGGLSNQDEINKLFSSEANQNPKHVDHKVTREKIESYYNRKYSNAPIS